MSDRYINHSQEPLTPESPCIRQCCLNEQDICVGCYRTLNEIVSWSASSDQQKIIIKQKCKIRKAQRHR